ncbi:MAG: bifunctional diguanylate cyclase/phosphodiesterase [Acidobacteria bacterium]|nr:bifunctional diguanylate cyclase/phosphodiesterase [Acidobacteriota bacterium]
MITSKKTYTILFGAALLLAIAILFFSNVEFSFGTALLIVLVAGTGFAFIVHLLYLLEERKSGSIRLTEFESAEHVERHIQTLRDHVEEQEKTTEALQKTKERYRYEAFHDALTKLPNRKQFLDKMGQWLRQSQQDIQFSFTVLSLDLNRFKTINESLGHSLGDALILKVAERLQNSIRQKDVVARFGGDEFGIILNNVSKTDDVAACVELIIKNLAEPFNIGSREIFTSVSVGIAVSHRGYEKGEDILRDADIAMYHAKSCEQSYVVFDPSMHTRAVTLLQIETDLRHAIERDEFVTYYQPIISLKSMKLIGFEALIRWNHPTRGLVPPVEFIPVTEVTNLIVPITLWILRKSCSQLAEWKRKYPNHSDLMISVNLSGKHFAQHDLVKQVKDILRDTKLDPRFLKLELTESAIMENAETAIFMLKRLRDIGVQLSIDDFGTGYSSLSYLHRFPINTLKVDRSFVGSMEEGSENGEIVRTIIALAKALNLSVIAEGIETVHQLHQLRVLNCEYGQGYLFSRPVPREQAEEIIRDTKDWKSILPPVEGNLAPTINHDLPTLELGEFN